MTNIELLLAITLMVIIAIVLAFGPGPNFWRF